VPPGYDGAKPAPLVVLLHGYGGTAAIQDGYFKLSDEADAKGFLLALPDGTWEPAFDPELLPGASIHVLERT